MDQPKVFIVHGFEGTPNGGWRPWLMGKLALEDVYACALPMPTPYAPTKDGWVTEIARAVGNENVLIPASPDGGARERRELENVFLVGHSLGVPAILQYLKSLPETAVIGGAVLVSGPYHNVDDGYRMLLESFFDPAYDFAHAKKVCKNFVVIHGSDDTVVPFSDAEEFSKALSCELISVENGGHLNGSSGWRELPPALDALIRFIKNKK